MTIADITEHAIALAEQGLHVFPTVPGGKAPACAGGHKSASDDPKEVARLFKAAGPGCGIGVSLKASGLVAIDWDAYKGDEDDRRWVEDVYARGFLEHARVHKTPKGGEHYIFDDGGIDKFPGHAGLTIDIKHDGYVLWPPSSGYVTLRVPQDFAEIPPALVTNIEAASDRMRRRLGATGTGGMLFATIEEALAALEENIEGRRHDALMRITLDLAKQDPEASISELVRQTVELIEPHLDHVDAARRAEILDDREGGEIWRLLERADDISGGRIDADMMARVIAKRGVPVPIGGASTAHTTWTSEAEITRQQEVARVEAIRTLEPLRFDPDDEAPLEPTRWVYGGHYIEGCVSMTVAPGGAGKSLLALTDAISIASGEEILGPRVYNRARVLYWNGEDSLSDLRKRSVAACRQHGITHTMLGDRLLLADATTLPINLVSSADYGKIEIHDAAIDALCHMLEELEVEVLILDPFVACHAVDENSNSQMEVVMTALREIAHRCGISIDVVHHTVKGSGDGKASAGSRLSMDSSRGASAVVNAARAVRALQPAPHASLQMWGVQEEHWQDVVEVFAVKSNQTRLSDNRVRFQKTGVELGNGDSRHPDGDTVVVALRYTPPEKPMPYSVDDMVKAAMVFASEDAEFLRHATQSPQWAGWAVARAIGADIGEGIARPDMTPLQSTERLRCKTLLRCLLETGVLHLVDFTDKSHQLRKAYELTASKETIRERVQAVYEQISDGFAEELSW